MLLDALRDGAGVSDMCRAVSAWPRSRRRTGQTLLDKPDLGTDDVLERGPDPEYQAGESYTAVSAADA